MKVLVTGGAGFIGSHIVDALLDKGHSVAVIDDMSTGSTENLNSRARFYKVDVTDANGVEKVFDEERPDLVSHHAAQKDVRRSMAGPAFDVAVNVLGTVNLIALSTKYGATRFIFASTCAVYSEPAYVPMDESHPTEPQSVYGQSKLAAESYLRLLCEASGLKYKVFRYGNVYGPRQNPKGEAGVVAIFAGQILTGAQPTIFGDGSKTRDYVFVKDIVAANMAATGAVGDSELVNLSCAREVSDYRIFELVREAAGATVDPQYAPKRPGEADKVSLDNTKAARVLDWKPTTTLEDGIRRSVEYYVRRHRRKPGQHRSPGSRV